MRLLADPMAGDDPDTGDDDIVVRLAHSVLFARRSRACGKRVHEPDFYCTLAYDVTKRHFTERHGAQFQLCITDLLCARSDLCLRDDISRSLMLQKHVNVEDRIRFDEGAHLCAV